MITRICLSTGSDLRQVPGLQSAPPASTSEYEPAEGRVRYERHADGRFSLTVTAHGGGVAVTVTVGGSGARGERIEPARREGDAP